MKDDKKYILSYGGGINSSALFFYIIEQKLPLDLVVFSDTGVESKETYKTVFNMKNICKEHNIEFVTVKSHLGNMYDYYFSKKKVMSVMKRDCTGKFKVSPIRRYIRKRYSKKQRFIMYIGIAYEEITRMKTSNVKYIKNSYPFCDDKIDRQGNIEILKRYNFKASKSGCVGCIYNKKAEWIKMIKEDHKEFKKWKLLDMQNSKYPKVTLCPTFKLEVLENNVLNQKTLDEFIDVEPSCDNINGGCFL